MNQEEFKLCCVIADGVKRGYPDLVDRFTHFPAGEKRSQLAGSRLKRQGLAPGWPDYQLMRATGGKHGLFIEVKIGDNNPSQKQKARIRALRKEGYAVALVYSFDEFFDALDTYLTAGTNDLFWRITRTTYDTRYDDITDW